MSEPALTKQNIARGGSGLFAREHELGEEGVFTPADRGTMWSGRRVLPLGLPPCDCGGFDGTESRWRASWDSFGAG